MNQSEGRWTTQQRNRGDRLARVQAVLGGALDGKVVQAAHIVDLLNAVLEPGDRVCLEGNNQKQADFLGKALTKVDTGRVHDLHMLLSVLSLSAARQAGH